MYDKTKICVPIFEKTYKTVIQAAKNSFEAGADLVEFRIDAMDHPNPDDVLNIIKDINHPLIATNRKIDEGGFFKGSESERTEILLTAAKHADIIDIELETDLDHMNKVIKASKSTIISYHDFKKTPPLDFLLDIVSRERQLGDIAKFAVMPKNLSDTIVVLNVLSKVEKTVGIAMGDMGRLTKHSNE